MSTDEILAMITRWELANVFPNSIDGDGFKLEDALRKAYGNEIRTHTALAKLRQQKNATETKLVRLELQLKEAEDESDFYADGYGPSCSQEFFSDDILKHMHTTSPFFCGPG